MDFALVLQLMRSGARKEAAGAAVAMEARLAETEKRRRADEAARREAAGELRRAMITMADQPKSSVDDVVCALSAAAEQITGSATTLIDRAATSGLARSVPQAAEGASDVTANKREVTEAVSCGGARAGEPRAASDRPFRTGADPAPRDEDVPHAVAGSPTRAGPGGGLAHQKRVPGGPLNGPTTFDVIHPP